MRRVHLCMRIGMRQISMVVDGRRNLEAVQAELTQKLLISKEPVDLWAAGRKGINIALHAAAQNGNGFVMRGAIAEEVEREGLEREESRPLGRDSLCDMICYDSVILHHYISGVSCPFDLFNQVGCVVASGAYELKALIKDIQVPRAYGSGRIEAYPILGFAPGRMDENTSRRFAFHLKFQKLGKSNM